MQILRQHCRSEGVKPSMDFQEKASQKACTFLGKPCCEPSATAHLHLMRRMRYDALHWQAKKKLDMLRRSESHFGNAGAVMNLVKAAMLKASSRGGSAPSVLHVLAS